MPRAEWATPDGTIPEVEDGRIQVRSGASPGGDGVGSVFAVHEILGRGQVCDTARSCLDSGTDVSCALWTCNPGVKFCSED